MKGITRFDHWAMPVTRRRWAFVATVASRAKRLTRYKVGALTPARLFRVAARDRLMPGEEIELPEIIEYGPRSGRTQEEAEIEGRRRVAENRSRLHAGVLIMPEDVDAAPGT